MPLPTREDAIVLLEGAVEARGFDLEDVEVAVAGPKSVLRVIVDSDTGLTLDDVVDLTGAVSAVLDEAPSVGGGRYTLEVTSRGVDRPLRLPRHWRRARGRRAAVRLGGEELTVRIGALTEDSDPPVVQLVVPGKAGPSIREVPLDAVERAVVQVEFSAPDSREAALAGGAEAGTGQERDK